MPADRGDRPTGRLECETDVADYVNPRNAGSFWLQERLPLGSKGDFDERCDEDAMRKLTKLLGCWVVTDSREGRRRNDQQSNHDPFDDTTDEKRVVPCTLSRDLFDHHRPEAICCSCGKLTRDATLCRCGAHVRCSDEACAACESQCGTSLQRRADLLAEMRLGHFSAWPFTRVYYLASGEERCFPVPLAHVFLHGFIYRLPTAALIGISDESLETMASQCPLVGADIASYIFAASGRPDYGSRRNRCLAIKR